MNGIEVGNSDGEVAGSAQGLECGVDGWFGLWLGAWGVGCGWCSEGEEDFGLFLVGKVTYFVILAGNDGFNVLDRMSKGLMNSEVRVCDSDLE